MSAGIIHVVLLKFDPAKLAEVFPGNSLQEAVQHLAKVIPGLLEVNMNARNITPWEGYQDATKGYTHCLVSKHTDAAALKVYAEFPEHKALQARFAQCVVDAPLRFEMDVPPKV